MKLDAQTIPAIVFFIEWFILVAGAMSLRINSKR